MSGLLRHGPAVLFAVAILVAVTSFIASLMIVPAINPGGASELGIRGNSAWGVVTGIAGALHQAALPFFGAALLDRLDRWKGDHA